MGPLQFKPEWFENYGDAEVIARAAQAKYDAWLDSQRLLAKRSYDKLWFEFSSNFRPGKQFHCMARLVPIGRVTK